MNSAWAELLALLAMILSSIPHTIKCKDAVKLVIWVQMRKIFYAKIFWATNYFNKVIIIVQFAIFPIFSFI